MISVEMEDVLAVLQLCKPYIIGNSRFLKFERCSF